MTPDAKRFLLELPDDAAARARFVEVLRASAARLDGELARELHLAAAKLCDHARVHGGACRYCDASAEGAQS